VQPDHSDTLAADLIWGVASIATFIGRTSRQTWEALDKGEMPSRRVNGRWVASRKALTAFLTGVDAGPAPTASVDPDAWLPHRKAIADGIKDRAAQEEEERTGKPVRRSPKRGAVVLKLAPRPGRGRAA